MHTSGIININKSEGWTSQDVVTKVRHVLGIRKAGHTGTLDPMATGVLPVCLGKATRIIEYLENDYKTYEAEMELGTVTDTLDRTGTVLETHPVNVTEEQVRQVMSVFDGWITQTPPMYSALKVQGKPLYQYAREGRKVDIRPRRTYIESMILRGFDPGNHRILFRVTCSKGTYIRSICDDIGRMLGCGGMMTALIRTGTGIFRIEDAVTIDQLMEMTESEREQCILPMDQPLVHLGELTLQSMTGTSDFRNGKPIPSSNVSVRREAAEPGDSIGKKIPGRYRAYDPELRFLGICRREENVFYPEKVLI